MFTLRGPTCSASLCVCFCVYPPGYNVLCFLCTGVNMCLCLFTSICVVFPGKKARFETRQPIRATACVRFVWDVCTLLAFFFVPPALSLRKCLLFHVGRFEINPLPAFSSPLNVTVTVITYIFMVMPSFFYGKAYYSFLCGFPDNAPPPFSLSFERDCDDGCVHCFFCAAGVL